jgi:hypothetical protein
MSDAREAYSKARKTTELAAFLCFSLRVKWIPIGAAVECGRRVTIEPESCLMYQLQYFRPVPPGFFLSPRHHLERLHVTLVLGHFQIVAGLEIHPECRSVLEVAGEAQCCVRGNPTPLGDNISDPRHQDAQVYRHLFMLRPRGTINSSLRISPGCTGFSFLAISPS